MSSLSRRARRKNEKEIKHEAQLARAQYSTSHGGDDAVRRATALGMTMAQYKIYRRGRKDDV